MSIADNRRPRQTGSQRSRREPLFPLEAEDIAPRIRRGPPAPLGDLVDDLNTAMPTKADRLRREVARPQPAPPRRTASPAPQTRVAASPASQTRVAAPGRSSRSVPQMKTQARPSMPPQPRQMLLGHLDRNLVAAQKRLDETEAALHQAKDLAAHLYYNYRPLRNLPPMSRNRWLVLGIVVVASLLIMIRVSGGGSPLLGTTSAENSHVQLSGIAHSAGDYSLRGDSSLSAQQIDAILASYGSPAAGTGAAWYDLGKKYGIDPAFAIAFFIMESSAGTDSGWAGIKADGSTTHNVGNIICAGYVTCYKGNRDYASWDEGIEGWYRLIDVEYIQGRGLQTLGDVLPIYCPFSDGCRPDKYAIFVQERVDHWRNGMFP